MMKFKTDNGGGVWMTFDNGWTVSIQSVGAGSAEIAAWQGGNAMYEFEDGEIFRKYVRMDDIADFIQFIKNKDRF